MFELAISPDSRWLVTGSADNTARLWDLTWANPVNSTVKLYQTDFIAGSVAISPDGRWLVTGGGYTARGNTARLWDLTSRDPATSAVVLRGHEAAVGAVAISPDGRWLVTVSDDMTARLWNLNIDSLIEQARRRAGPSQNSSKKRLIRIPAMRDPTGAELKPGLILGE